MIRSARDCETEASRAGLFKHTQVSLKIGIDPDEEERTEKRLNELQDECGCTATAITLLVTFIPTFVWIWSSRPAGSSTRSAIGLTMIAFVAFALLASVVKLATIWISRQRYRRTLRELASSLRTVSGDGGDHAYEDAALSLTSRGWK